MEIYNGYEYNDCGVCVTPDNPHTFGSYKDSYFAIRTSPTPRGWVYGYDCAIGTRGCGVGCRYNAENAYPSKSKAIVACAERIKEWYGNDKGASKAIAELDRIIQVHTALKPQIKQFTIFDYL